MGNALVLETKRLVRSFWGLRGSLHSKAPPWGAARRFEKLSSLKRRTWSSLEGETNSGKHSKKNEPAKKGERGMPGVMAQPRSQKTDQEKVKKTKNLHREHEEGAQKNASSKRARGGAELKKNGRRGPLAEIDQPERRSPWQYY